MEDLERFQHTVCVYEGVWTLCLIFTLHVKSLMDVMDD